MSEVNWSEIRKDYELGMSLRALSAKYDIPKTTLIRKRDAQKWSNETRTGPVDHTPTPVTRFPIPDDAVSIARIGLHQLAQHLQSDTMLEIRDHKSLSDALAQYVKVLQTAPQEPESKEGLVIPLEKLSPHTRQEIRRLLVEDAQEVGRTG